MKILFNAISVFFFFTFYLSVFPNDRNLIQLNLSNIKYDKMELKVTLEDNSTFSTFGTSSDQQHWQFIYPDSIKEKILFMGFTIPTQSDTLHLIKFITLNEKKDTLTFGNFSVKEKKTILNAELMNSTLNLQNPFFGFKDSRIDNLYVSYSNDEEFNCTGEAIHIKYCMFFPWLDGKEVTYEQSLEKYLSLINKYPDSQYLISILSSNYSSYKSITDIEKAFNSFTEEKKNSLYGQKIKQALENLAKNYFENSVLPSWDTHILEPIIKDTIKYNLVVFSASWCGPCHKQIPILKQIYYDLKEYLDIVYVSIDEYETTPEWKELMVSQDIPWRSVLAVDNIKEIQDKYSANRIPLTLLVEPSGKMQRIDVREQKNVDELYNLRRND